MFDFPPNSRHPTGHNKPAMYQAPTDASTVDALEPAARMQALGNALYPAICQLLGEPLAGKVTGMLIEMPTQSVLDCLAAPETLKTTVEQALKVLSTDVCTMAAGEAAAATAEAAVA